ncbi:MAG TPA: hypothetical protein VK608_04625, partial [Edaphobacter sp.]|nr:hypothetical protein [Edaphobacter sp.]
IQAFDENTAIVMSSGKGDLSRLYKTTDGCATWKLLFTNPDKEGFWDALKFSSKDHNFGVLLGDPVGGIFVVMLTFDGGEKWERQTLKPTAEINGESVFAASNSSLLISYPGGRMFGTGGRGGPRVISLGSGPTDVYEGDVSQTKKLPWSASQNSETLPSNSQSETAGIFSFAIDNGPTGPTVVAVGGDFKRPDDRGNTAWTNVFENSSDPKRMFGFKAAKTPPHGYRSSVAYDPNTKTWITVGPNGTDISTDDGKNWRPLKPTQGEPVDADKNWNALSLPFVVGPNGRIGKLRAIAISTAESSKDKKE